MASFKHSSECFGAIEIAPKGYIDAGNNEIQNVKYPVQSKDATNKEYVDRLLDMRH